MFAFLEIDIIPSVLFSCVHSLYTEMLINFEPCKCGTVVTHRTIDVKVFLGKSSNPPRIMFSFGKLRS